MVGGMMAEGLALDLVKLLAVAALVLANGFFVAAEREWMN